MNNSSDISDQLIFTIDVGGTKTKINVFDNVNQEFLLTSKEEIENTEFQQQYLELPAKEVPETFVNHLFNLIEEKLNKLNKDISSIFGIGIGVPAQVEENGNINRIPAFGITNLNLQQELGERLNSNGKIKICVIQDVKMHTLGMYRALKEQEQNQDTRSLMVISAGTAAGIGIIVDSKLIDGSEFRFPSNVLRGYGIKWSIEKDAKQTNSCRDLGWKVAGTGIKSTFIERVMEVFDSSAAKAIINNSDITQLGNPSYTDILDESDRGCHLARRICIKTLDPDNVNNQNESPVQQQIEDNFKNTVTNFKDSRFLKNKLGIKDWDEFLQLNIANLKNKLLQISSEDKDIPEYINDYADNDIFCRNIIEECAEILGLSLSIIIPIINPSHIIFAGGISNSKIWVNKVKTTISLNSSCEEECFLDIEKIIQTKFPNHTALQLLGAVELIRPIASDKPF